MGVFAIVVALSFGNYIATSQVLDPFIEYCPMSINCSDDVISQNNVTSSLYELCCGTCSCHADCGYSQSCCFDDDNAVYTRDNGRECVESYLGDHMEFLMTGGHGVMMVTTCLERSIDCKHINNTVHIQPVQTSTNIVYINEQCAQCNKVTHYKHWAVKLITHGLNSNVFLRINDSKYDAVTRIYVSPLNSHVTVCNTSFVPIDYSKCPNETFRQLCRSVALPFHHVNKYALYIFKNIFCFYCVNDGNARCQSADFKTPIGKFILMLDSDVDTESIVSYYTKQKLRTDYIENTGCPDNFIKHPTRVRPKLCW